MTGREILAFNARIRGIEPEGAIKRVAAQTEIAGYIDRRSGGYSRGMKQRLALAAALISDPEILMHRPAAFWRSPFAVFSLPTHSKLLLCFAKASTKLVDSCLCGSATLDLIKA